MNISKPNYDFSKLQKIVHSKFDDSTTYLGQVLEADPKTSTYSKISNTKPWVSYHYYHQCIREIENGSIEKAREYYDKILTSRNVHSDEKIRIFNTTNLNSDELTAINKWILVTEEGKINISELDQDKYGPEALQRVREAIEMLRHVLPDFYQEYRHFCDEIILVGKGDANYLESGSTFDLYGLNVICYREDKSAFSFIESIVHEVAHLVLFALSTEHELVFNPPDERFSGPFRKDPRPMGGNYHAMFVLCRLLQAFHTLSKSNLDLPELPERKKMLVDRWSYTCDLIKEKGKLSDTAKDLFLECERIVNPIL